jgi:hypothetical protein
MNTDIRNEKVVGATLQAPAEHPEEEQGKEGAVWACPREYGSQAEVTQHSRMLLGCGQITSYCCKGQFLHVGGANARAGPAELHVVPAREDIAGLQGLFACTSGGCLLRVTEL